MINTTELQRQASICNACRYCEGYCAVFPALHRLRELKDSDLVQLSNVCHNCRGCYYACQYTAPHVFAVNFPLALAEVREESWQQFAWPGTLSRWFNRSGVWVTVTLVVLFTLAFAALQSLLTGPAVTLADKGFYRYLSHGVLVAIFTPAFVLPLLAVVMSLRRYFQEVGPAAWVDVIPALKAAATMKNLKGGHGQGCNFESEDRFSHLRRHSHQAAMYGFLLCFASTSSATVLHYVFNVPAPYPLLSLPKLLGIPGGILLCAGTVALAVLKIRADRNLSAPHTWGADMAFIMLLFAVSATGLVLFAVHDTDAVGIWLPVHLGTVLTLFVLTPYSKMMHGFFRLAALAREAHVQIGVRADTQADAQTGIKRP